MVDEKNLLLDAREAAAILKIHPKTLLRLARSGEIRAIRIGKLWRVPKREIDAYVETQLHCKDHPRRVK
jgi:excisionase family DNA binding protein